MTIKSFTKKIFSPIVVGNCLGMVLLTVVLAFAAMAFLQCYTEHGEEVTVPNIRGQKLEIAQQKLEALGLECEVTDTGYVDTYVGDVVLDQSFEPGTKVKPGRVINLVINASSARAIPLPQLADNSSRREAEAKLRVLGFNNINIEYTPGDRDWVYNIKVRGVVAQAGERLTVTTPITLVIGDGGVDEEFNGDDSLDYEIFGGYEEDYGDDAASSGGEGTETAVED